MYDPQRLSLRDLQMFADASIPIWEARARTDLPTLGFPPAQEAPAAPADPEEPEEPEETEQEHVDPVAAFAVVLMDALAEYGLTYGDPSIDVRVGDDGPSSGQTSLAVHVLWSAERYVSQLPDEFRSVLTSDV